MTTPHESARPAGLPTPAEYSRKLDAWDVADERIKQPASEPDAPDAGTAVIVWCCLGLCFLVAALFICAF